MIWAQCLVLAVIVVLTFKSVHDDAERCSMTINVASSLLAFALILAVLYCAGTFDQLIPSFWGE